MSTYTKYSPPEPKVSIIIPAYNSEKTIGMCLDSIFSFDYPSQDLEVIVIDNGSIDRTIEIAKQYNVRLHIRARISIGGMRNFGAAQSCGEILAFVDSDCVLSNQWLSAALPYFADPGIAAAGCGYSHDGSPSWIEKHWYYLHTSQPGEASFLPSGNMIVRRSAFTRIGGFDPDLETGEDSDLCLRLRKAGSRIISDPKIRNVHLGNPKTLKTFFRKEIWYGKGLKACISSDNWTDRTFLLTNLFLFGLIILFCGQVSNLFLRNYEWVSWVGLSAVVSVILTASVYRSIRKGQITGFFHLLVLCTAYYSARSISLVLIYSEMMRAHVRRGG